MQPTRDSNGLQEECNSLWVASSLPVVLFFTLAGPRLPHLWLFGRTECRQMTDAPAKKQGAADNVPVAELEFVAKPDSGHRRACAVGYPIEKPLGVLDVGFLLRRLVCKGIEEEGGGALGPGVRCQVSGVRCRKR